MSADIEGEVRADGLRVGYSSAPPHGTPNSNGSLNQYGAHDLLYDADSLKLYARALILTDVGDPPDLCLRRANLTDQNDYPQGTPSPIEDGQNLGTFYWMGWANTGEGLPGGFQTRAAQVYVRSKGDQDLVNHGGELYLATAPQDTAGNPQDALVLRHDGVVDIVRGALNAAHGLTVEGVPLVLVPRTSYTPTWTGITLGSATVDFRWSQVGTRVSVEGVLTFAADTVVTGQPVFSLPVPAASVNTRRRVGTADFYDNGVTTYHGNVTLQSATTAWARRLVPAGSNVTNAAVDATTPHTWAVGDQYMVDLSYEAA